MSDRGREGENAPAYNSHSSRVQTDWVKLAEREREHLGIPLILLARDIERESDLAQKLYFKAIQLGEIHPSHVRPLCKKVTV